MKRIVFSIIFIFTGIIGFAQHQTKDSVLMFSYFKDNGEDGLHFAYSEDGFRWNALKNDSSYLSPTVGNERLIRDPCIIQGPDGVFRLICTVSWKDKGIGYASSIDLIHWSAEKFIPVMKNIPGSLNCWAPELVYDQRSDQYMIYWATTIPGKFPDTDSTGEDNYYNHRMYYTLTKDFISFSKSKLLYDPGFSTIDATIKIYNGQYIMIFKDETFKPLPKKNIHIAFSLHLTYGYGNPSSAITGKYWAEGPTAVLLNHKWIVYFDKYMDHTMGAVTSSDLKNWTDISDKIVFPSGTRHGTVFKVSRQVLNRMLANQ
jgi:hypothetical protein